MPERPSPAATGRRSVDVIRGGDAWVVPYEPGASVWAAVSAPTIRILDRRRATVSVSASAAVAR